MFCMNNFMYNIIFLLLFNVMGVIFVNVLKSKKILSKFFGLKKLVKNTKYGFDICFFVFRRIPVLKIEYYKKLEIGKR